MKIYNKLVRDNIPNIIRDAGKNCLYHIADEEEYFVKLKEKLHEEATEFTEDPCLDEAADLVTVFAALMEAYDLDLGEIFLCALEKEKGRGSFESRVILESVED